MNTFLPFQDFKRSASCLDKRRCFKQVVEAYQLLNTLRGLSKGWQNHPCTKMWKNYEDCLQYYYNEFYDYCLKVHKINFIKLPKPVLLPKYMEYPDFLGYQPFHYSHQCNLLRKSLEDLSKGRRELHENLAKNNIFCQDHDLNTPYMWTV